MPAGENAHRNACTGRVRGLNIAVIEQLSVRTDEGDFDAIAAGPEDGRPVLLLHGFPEAAVEWEHQVAVLGREGFRAVAFDQRGYSPGARPERAADYGVDALVGDVLAVADSFGWSRFDLVGHDWGGAVAWWTAAEHPERLRKLVVVSTPHPGAFAEALRTDEDQHLRSGYMTEWRNSNTEKRMLDDGGAALRQMFEWRVPPSRVDEYVRADVRAGRADRGAELVPRRASGRSGREGLRAHDVRVEHRGRGVRVDGGAEHRRLGHRPVPVRDAGGRVALGAGGGAGGVDGAAPGAPVVLIEPLPRRRTCSRV